MSKRIEQDIIRGREVTIFVNGKPVTSYEGETIAAALLTAGYMDFHLMGDNSPRAPYCNMGTCFTCRVGICDESDQAGTKKTEPHEHTKWVRACLTQVSDGIKITTGKRL